MAVAIICWPFKLIRRAWEKDKILTAFVAALLVLMLLGSMAFYAESMKKSLMDCGCPRDEYGNHF